MRAVSSRECLLTVMLPSSGGMEPVSRFEARSNELSLVMRPSSLGMDPWMRFWCKPTNRNDVELPSSGGIVPPNLSTGYVHSTPLVRSFIGLGSSNHVRSFALDVQSRSFIRSLVQSRSLIRSRRERRLTEVYIYACSTR